MLFAGKNNKKICNVKKLGYFKSVFAITLFSYFIFIEIEICYVVERAVMNMP